jgi:hypothetical protein
VQGPLVVTADAISLPTGLEIINLNHYIATISTSINLEIEFKIEYGTGYKLASQTFLEENENYLQLDAIFMPIQKVDFKIDNTFQLIYKFGLEEMDDETIIVIHPDTYQVDVAQPIYEFITVSLPQRIVHEEGKCNQEMIDSLNKYLSSKKEEPNNDDIDPRWSALKNLN